MIQKLEVVHYPRDTGNYTIESFNVPDWDTVFGQLQSMHPYEIPILTLLRYAERPDSDIMVVNGGKERKFTWPLEIASTIIKHYFNSGEGHPGFQWE